MLIFAAGFVGGWLLALAVWATAGTHLAQRAFPALGLLPRVKDHGYRVFRLLLDGPSEDRVRLANECRLFADSVRRTLSEPPLKARGLPPGAGQQARYMLRHLDDVQALLGRAAEVGAISRHIVPSANTPFSIPPEQMPAFCEETARRLETGLRLRKISRALGREIPAGTPFVYLGT